MRGTMAKAAAKQQDDTTPELGPEGNPPPQGVVFELEKLFEDAANESAPVAEPPAADAEPEPAEPEKPDPEPEPEKPPPPPATLPEYKKLRRKERTLAKREQRIAEREAQFDALAKAGKIDDPIRRWEALAELVGLDGTELYRQVTKRHVAPDGQQDAAPPDGQLTMTAKQIDELVAKKLEEATRQREQQTRAQYLDDRVDELVSIRRTPELAQRFPVLASLPEQRLMAEVAQAVAYASEKHPQALRNMPAFAQALEDSLREEYATTLRGVKNVDSALIARILGGEGDGSPTPNPEQAKPAPAKADASRRKTITDHDTSSGGGHAGREDTEEERLRKLQALFEDQRRR